MKQFILINLNCFKLYLLLKIFWVTKYFTEIKYFGNGYTIKIFNLFYDWEEIL